MTKPSKKLRDESIELMRLYLGGYGRIPARSHERIYKRLMKKIEKIALGFNVSTSEVWEQAEDVAKRKGLTTPIPGKDY